MFETKREVIVKEKNEYYRSYPYIKFYNSDNFVPKNIEDVTNIYYNILNNGYNDFTLYCPSEYETCKEDFKNVAKDDNLLSNINNYVNPFNSFKDINTEVYEDGKIYIKVNKNYDENKINLVNNKIDYILNILHIDNINNNENKIKKIHEYLLDNINYDEKMVKTKQSEYDSHSAYGALIENYAVCNGYSDTFALFLDRLHIPNIKISSKNHVWNLIYLNGKWLHLDATWNDVNNEKYMTSYYLIDTKSLLKLDPIEHKFDEHFYLEAN